MADNATVDELKVLITAQTKKFEKQMQGITKQLKGLDKEAGKSVNGLGDKFKNLGSKVASASKVIAASVAAIGAAMVGVTESTREFREDLARLQTVAATTNRNFGEVRDQFMRIYEISGEVDSSVEAMNNLMATGFSGGALKQIVNELNGAAIAFSDTLKIEGLADGLQETLATGKSIGPFDELLSRLGVNLDNFNTGLQEAIKNGTEQNYILNTLANSGLSNVNDAYRQMNSELVKGRQVRMELQMAFADLGKAFEPIISAVIPYITKFIQLITKAINYTVIFVKTLFGKESASNVVESQNKAIEQLNKSTAAVNKNVSTGANKTDEMSGNLGDASKEAKKLQKTLAGFDEINTLSFNNNEDASKNDSNLAPIGIDIASFEMPDISPFEEQIAKIPDAWTDALNRIKDTLKNMFDPWADSIKKYFPDFLDSAKELGKGIGKVFSALGNSLEGIFAHKGYRLFVDGLVGAFTEGFGFLVDMLNGTVLPLLEGFFEAFDPGKSKYMDRFMNTLGETAQKTKDAAGAIRKAFEPVFEMLAPKFNDLGYAIGTVFVGVLDLVVSAWGSFMDAINPDKNPVMNTFINVLGTAVGSLLDMVSAIGMHIVPIFEQLKPIVDRLITSLIDLALIIGDQILKVLAVFFDKLDPNKNPAMAELIAKAGELVSKITELYAVIAEKLKPIFEKLTPVLEFIAGLIADLLIEAITSFIEAVTGMIDIIAGLLTGDWERVWEGAKEVVTNVWVFIFGKFRTIFANILKVFTPLTKFFQTLMKGIEKVFNTFGINVGKYATKAWNLISSPFKKAASWFNTKFDDVKKKIKEKLDLKKIGQDAWNAITRPFQNIKNWFDQKLQPVKDLFGSIGNLFGGGSSKTSAKIPKMARGGIVSTGQQFIAGESGKEVVMPLENNTQWLDIVANKLMQGMLVGAPQQGNQQATINLYLDKDMIGKASVDFINKKSKIEGRSVLKSQFV